MAPPSPTSYISFNELTNDVVQEWINASNDEYFILKKEELKQKLIDLAAQPVVTIKAPF